MNISLTAVPIVVDAVTLLLHIILLPGMAAQMQTPSGSNALLLVVAYILFCIGVYLVRKLEGQPGAENAWRPPALLLSRQGRGVLAVLFGLALMTAVAQQLGYFELLPVVSARELGEGEAAAYFVFAPGAWLGASLFYILILAFAVKPTISYQSGRYLWATLLGLLGANALLLPATAQIRALIAQAGAGGNLGLAVAAFALFLLLFGPPRLLYLSKQPRLSTLVTFLVLLGYCSWTTI